MKNLIIIGLLLLSSCTWRYHLEKAVKKNPELQKEIIDTVRFESVHFDTIFRNDSTYYIEKHTYHHDTIIRYTKVQADFSQMKTWWETVQENKTERTKIRNDRKENKTKIRQENKTDRTKARQESKTKRGRSWWWLWLAIGFTLSFVVRILWKRVLPLINANK